ncbi:MAG: LysM peptidoglycan-binding domain-containing protein [Verrucomicrobiota bacterium]
MIFEKAVANPSFREDAQIERQQILKAADQLETLTRKMESMQLELIQLREQVNSLQKENTQLKNSLSTLDKRSEQERKALLNEVGKIVAESSSQAPAVSQVPTEGYEHVVQKGQNLWVIAQAFRQQGVQVTVDDLKKANNLKEGDVLSIGQKLFIPKR